MCEPAKLVRCPCCKGAKRLRVAVYNLWDEETGEVWEGVRMEDCTHCQATGKVAAEIDD
jgi:hypothetical protein